MKEQTILKTNDQNSADISWKTDAKDLLLDLKAIIKEYFVATFTQNENELKLDFNNGQSFTISVKECCD